MLEAEGYVVDLYPPYPPRQLFAWYESGTAEADAQAAIAATGSTVIEHAPGSTDYLIETPLGKSLQEVMDELESNPSFPATVTDAGDGIIDALFYYELMAEEESGRVWYLTGGSFLRDVELEYVVRVRGSKRWTAVDGTPVIDPVSADILRDRVVQKHGTIALVDRGAEGTVVILVEDSGDAWELLGVLAGEIAALSGIDGAGVTVDGCERPVSLTSRAGGLELRVTSYVLD